MCSRWVRVRLEGLWPGNRARLPVPHLKMYGFYGR